MASPTHHPDIEQMSGDDWSIVGTLTDTNGQPLDLTNAALEWTLVNPDGKVAIPDGSAQIVMVSPMTSGIISINVPRNITAQLSPGRHTDALRVTIADLADTLWIGTILVGADLFSITVSI
jgi:hypothetical protein